MDRQLYQVAILHYEKGLAQQEISNLLGLSKMTVSRLLQKAKDQGIVRIIVNAPFARDKELEKKIRNTYKVDDVWVFKSPSKTIDLETQYNSVAQNAAFLINTDPPSHTTVGLGIGRMIGQLVKHLTPLKTVDTSVIQLMGGLPDVSKENPFTIIQETCTLWGASGTYIPNLATVEDQGAKESFFRYGDTGKMASTLWEQCDLAIFSVGAIENGTFLSPSLVTGEEMAELRNLHAVGDILGHCFTIDGEFIPSGLENRLISIPIDLLANSRTRRAVVVGSYKTDALKGALRTGLINELITDDITALTLF
jgi:deoxyribonucleoside regulator